MSENTVRRCRGGWSPDSSPAVSAFTPVVDPELVGSLKRTAVRRQAEIDRQATADRLAALFKDRASRD